MFKSLVWKGIHNFYGYIFRLNISIIWIDTDKALTILEIFRRHVAFLFRITHNTKMLASYLQKNWYLCRISVSTKECPNHTKVFQTCLVLLLQRISNISWQGDLGGRLEKNNGRQPWNWLSVPQHAQDVDFCYLKQQNKTETLLNFPFSWPFKWQVWTGIRVTC